MPTNLKCIFWVDVRNKEACNALKEMTEDIKEVIRKTKEAELKRLNELYKILFDRPSSGIHDPELTESEADELCFRGDKAFYIGEEGKLPDYCNAMRLYYDAAQCDSARACGCLGIMYERGLGAEPNLESAAEFYGQGADMDDPHCIFMLGRCYEKAIIGKDMDETDRIDKAINLYERAARKNNPDAMAKLGYMHEKGIHVEQDKEKAIKYYKMAINNENPLAMNYLGAYYFRNNEYEEAVKLFIEGALMGSSRAANNLGTCYENGHGISKDYFEAIKWYKKAATKGYPESMVNLGFLYLKQGKAYNNTKYYEQALKWLIQAKRINQNPKDTNYALGIMFLNGLGTERDLCAAINCFEKADELGHAFAAKGCADTYIEMAKAAKIKNEVKKYSLKISDCYEKGYNQGDLSAGYKLALTRIEGKWVEKNEEAGLQLMKELAKKKMTEAKEFLKSF